MFSSWQQLLSQRRARCWMCCLLHLQLPGSSGLPPHHVCQALCNQAMAARSRDVGPGSELETQSQAAPRFSAGDEAEAAAWASHFLQREREDAERSCLVQERGVKSEERSPAGGKAGCVLLWGGWDCPRCWSCWVGGHWKCRRGTVVPGSFISQPGPLPAHIYHPVCAETLPSDSAGQPHQGLAVLGLPFSFWRVWSDEQGFAWMESHACGYLPLQGEAQTSSRCRFSN